MAAELLGTGLLVTVVVGSGIAASRLSPDDVGLQLLENALATAGGLAILILVFGGASGAHLNPVISLADWWLGRRAGTGLTPRETSGYVSAQLAGGVGGAALAHAMYAEPLLSRATTERSGTHLLLGEVVATAGLVLLVFALARTGRSGVAPWAVGVYIGAAYWFTSSTSFANPAVTVGRMLSDTFAGIAPAAVPGFLAAQLAGAALGVAAVLLFYPDAGQAAGEVVVPRAETGGR